jgi:DNA mismatch endonuclease (patch repair protein)
VPVKKVGESRDDSRISATRIRVIDTPCEAGPKRRHRGDTMSPETRSRVMARIRGKDTGPERIVAAGLVALGLPFETHARDLPGRPDFVLRKYQIAIFVDGDFWHGWRFSQWRDKLSPAWEAKIARNRARDASNFRRLRRLGWAVIRIWEHQLKQDGTAWIGKIAKRVDNPADYHRDD